MQIKQIFIGCILLLITAANTTFAQGNADVVDAKARSSGEGVWHFTVTVQHPDTGWEDYADGWDVVLPDGTVVKPNPSEQFTRTLWHPHVNEQPFTRSQGNVEIPASVNEVTIRAHDKPDGFGGKEITLSLEPD